MVIQIDGFAAASEIDVTLPEAGQVYNVLPPLRYDFQRLAALDQSVPANATYAVTVNGTDLGQQTLPIRIRSANDVPFLAQGPDGKPQDLTVLFAAYVNESHPFVDKVLQQALNYHAVNRFVGYQQGPDMVRLQVFAVWNVLQRNHIHYSSVTTPSAASPSGHVYSQAVRFIDQSIVSQQANCVDGSVLFASLMYKIGIQPVLVHKPGHMFVGYYLDEGHKQVEFLETTMLGAGHQPVIAARTQGLLFVGARVGAAAAPPPVDTLFAEPRDCPHFRQNCESSGRSVPHFVQNKPSLLKRSLYNGVGKFGRMKGYLIIFELAARRNSEVTKKLCNSRTSKPLARCRATEGQNSSSAEAFN